MAGIELAAIGLASVAMAADVAGGVLATRGTLKESRYVIALASGIVIAAAFLELIPESFAGVSEDQAGTIALVMAIGFFLFYLIEKLLVLHTHEAKELEGSHTGSSLVVGGMAADNVIDGIGIAVAYAIDPLLAVALTVAIVAHEIPQGAASAILLRRANYTTSAILGVLLLAGAMYPLGAGIASFLPSEWNGPTLAFVAGAFVYIGAGDLLLEAHRKFNWKVVALVIAGAILMYAVSFVEKLRG